jgi:DNA-binding HxlR family transcriptional regulator
MPPRRTYAEHGDACSAAHAMDVIGDRWALIIARELLLGPKRFNELLDSARGITPAVLAARLRELEQASILVPSTLPPPARVKAYSLTDWGRGLDPIIRALGRWAQDSPERPTGGGLTPDGVVIAMRTMAPTKPVPEPIELQLRLYDRRSRHDDPYDYRLTWSGIDLDIWRGTHPDPPTTVTSDSSTWSRLLFDHLDLAAAERHHGLTITGDRRMVRKLSKAFQL